MSEDEAKKFGEIAVELGFATRTQVEDALEAQQAMADMDIEKRIGEVLRYKGHMTRSQIREVLRRQGRYERGDEPFVPGYQILDKIGRGGMGDVYRARQVSMDRIVALKVIPAANKGHIKRMRREARWIGRVSHPNIIQGFDVGETEEVFFFSMEYVKGRTLHDIIVKEGVLGERRAVTLAMQIAQAIGALWNEHIVHRDVKPGNIMVTNTGVAKLCDLGLAIDVKEEASHLLDEPGMAVGTPFYMSPEQVEGRRLPDVRSDLYSLGATLYRMVSGEPPFNGATRAIILSKHLLHAFKWPKVVNPALSDDICLLIAKLMEREPDQRYQTVDQAVLDMEDFLAGRAPRIASGAAPFWMPQARWVGGQDHDDQQRLDRLRAFARLRASCLSLAAGETANLQRLCTRLGEFAEESDTPEFHVKIGLLLLTAGDYAGAHRAFAEACKRDARYRRLLDVTPTLNCPEWMVFVPGGEFEPLPTEDDPSPEPVMIEPFYIDESAVTNRQYAEFVRATGRPTPAHWEGKRQTKDDYDSPVTNVSWEDAAAYAAWRGGRLPTGVEWELAARGLEPRLYPWGDTFSSDRCLAQPAEAKGPCPVGTFFGGRSPYGCYDMSGNVWEWTADDAPQQEGKKIVRGGSWQDPPERVTCASRDAREERRGYPDCGFRVVKDLTIEEP